MPNSSLEDTRNFIDTEGTTEIVTEKWRDYYLKKMYFFHNFCILAMLYIITINTILLIIPKTSFFQNYYGDTSMIKFLSVIIFFGILISLYFTLLKRNINSASKPVIITSTIIFQIISCGLLAVFNSAFTVAKNLLGYFNPYQWDESFAILDQSLHGGTDPWILYFPALQALGIEPATVVYIHIWGFLNFFLPVFVLLFETNPALRLRFFLLYGIVWVGLGNFVAGVFLSAGPVYYGLVTGDAGRFADLFAAIDAYGFQATITPRLQAILWTFHVEGRTLFGTGISAFPSVHVAMATLIGLYLWRKLGRFGAVALLFPLAIQIYSVLLGWHYAVDGYFSIIVVVAAWYACARFQRRREARSRLIGQNP